MTMTMMKRNKNKNHQANSFRNFLKSYSEFEKQQKPKLCKVESGRKRRAEKINR